MAVARTGGHLPGVLAVAIARGRGNGAATRQPSSPPFGPGRGYFGATALANESQWHDLSGRFRRLHNGTELWQQAHPQKPTFAPRWPTLRILKPAEASSTCGR